LASGHIRGVVAWTNDLVAKPPPDLRSSDADGVRASELQHSVQDMNGDADLCRPTLTLVRAQSVANDLLVAPDGGLNAAPFVVASHLLPPDPAFLGNALEMAVALGRLARRCYTGYCRRTRGSTMTAASGWWSATAR
jgi:hypothetical protein